MYEKENNCTSYNCIGSFELLYGSQGAKGTKDQAKACRGRGDKRLYEREACVSGDFIGHRKWLGKLVVCEERRRPGVSVRLAGRLNTAE